MATRGKQSGDKWASSRKTTASSACRRHEVGVEKVGEALKIKEKLSSRTHNDPNRLSMSDWDFHIVKTKEIIPGLSPGHPLDEKGIEKGKKPIDTGLEDSPPNPPQNEREMGKIYKSSNQITFMTGG